MIGPKKKLWGVWFEGPVFKEWNLPYGWSFKEAQKKLLSWSKDTPQFKDMLFLLPFNPNRKSL